MGHRWAPLLRVVDDLLSEVLHDTTQFANNRIECDHGRNVAPYKFALAKTLLEIAAQGA